MGTSSVRVLRLLLRSLLRRKISQYCVCVSKGRDKCSERRQLGILVQTSGRGGCLVQKRLLQRVDQEKSSDKQKGFGAKKRIASRTSTLECGSTLSSKHGGEGAMKAVRDLKMGGCHSGVAKIPTPRLEDDGECGRRGVCQSTSRRLCNGLHVCCEIAGLVGESGEA